MKLRRVTMNMLVCICLIGPLMTTHSPPVYAGGYPVHDWINRLEIMKSLQQLKEIYDLSKDQISLIAEELQATWEMVKFGSWIYDAVTGEWDISAWAQRQMERAVRKAVYETMPDAYSDFYDLTSIGELGKDGLMEVIRRKRGSQPLIPEMFMPKNDEVTAEQWRRQQATIEAAQATAEVAYDTIAELEKELADLFEQIPNTPNLSAQNRLRNRFELVSSLIVSNEAKAKMAGQVLEATKAQAQVNAYNGWKIFTKWKSDTSVVR